MNTITINSDLLEPETKPIDEDHIPIDIIKTTLLYSIAVSLKKIREKTESIDLNIYEEIVRKIHNT